MNKNNFLKLTLLIPALTGLLFMSSVPTESASNTATTTQQEKEKVYVENTTFDFGTIAKDGDKVTATFIVHNDSDAPISLISVTASCGCTTPNWTKEPIAPGATAEIKTVFNPKGQFGTINKRVTAKTDSGATLTMNIKGIVE